MAAACRQRGDECVIVTGDRDSFQLEENVDNYLYLTVHRKPKKSRESAKADSTDEDHGGGGGKF